MKITSMFPESSFLSAEKDMNLIIEKMLNNERLKRLLYYTSDDCLSRPNLTKEQTSVTIKYEEKTTTQSITVEEKAITGISINKKSLFLYLQTSLALATVFPGQLPVC